MRVFEHLTDAQKHDHGWIKRVTTSAAITKAVKTEDSDYSSQPQKNKHEVVLQSALTVQLFL